MDRPEVLEFGQYRLDLRCRTLSGDDGGLLSMTPKVFETLRYLIENSDRVVTKDELMSAIWPDTSVEENNLNKNISVLRKLLGERRGSNKFIVTVPGCGYRFVAPVRSVAEVDAAAGVVPNKNGIDRSESGRRYDVERHGNVLALVDWADPNAVSTAELEEEPEVPRSIVASASVPDGRFSSRYFVTVGIVIVAIIFSLGLWSYYAARPDVVGAPEKSLTYLLNGRAVASPVISPDGKYFAYSDFDGEVARMWIQQVGQPRPIEIVPATKLGLGEITFTPDGQFVYFWARDEQGTTTSLYRAAAFGTVYTKILDHVHSPVSFSPDGTEMAFSRYDKENNESSILIAKSDGRDERVLVTRRLTSFVAYPAWSPDGSVVAFEENTLTGEDGSHYCTLAGIAPNGEGLRTLSPEKWGTCYRMGWTTAGDGIVFVGTRSDETLTTKRNQLWHLSLVDGKAIRISNEGFWYDFGGITDDNTVLALAYDRAAQIWAMDASGDARTAMQLTTGRWDGRGGIAPLPDGRVGYISRNDDKLEIWTVESDGSGRKQILNDPSAIEELRATPDGKYFVFALWEGKRSRLFRINTDGSGLTRLTNDDRIDVDSAISPDGRSLVYGTISYEQDYGRSWLQQVSIEGDGSLQLTGADSDANTPHFSPDGRFLSYIFKHTKISIMTADGSSVVRTFDPVMAPRLNVGARWTPDGQAVAYIVHRKNVSNIWLQPVNGDEPRPLTDFTSGEIYNFAFSTDGSRLYLARGYPVSDTILIRNFAR